MGAREVREAGEKKGERQKKLKEIIQQCLMLGNGKRAKGRKPRKKEAFEKKLLRFIQRFIQLSYLVNINNLSSQKT